MLMILTEKVTRSEKINNVETYTAVQIKQQYGDYQGKIL